VTTQAGPVQGYDNGLGALWGNEAAAFNAKDRRRSDTSWDLVAVARYRSEPMASYQLGYARKTRAPNLYQRYPWSTQAMAALMNNFAGDGNGYIGNLDLRPEVANTLSLTADWRAADDRAWALKSTAYITHINDYIDARRCNFGQCSADTLSSTQGFVLLQYANQRALLRGIDLSAQARLFESPELGTLDSSFILKIVRGDVRSDVGGNHGTTGDGLYNTMPPNATWALEQRAGRWNAVLEVVGVAAKRRVSQVRNEIKTPGYALLNLRGSYEWPALRLDFGVDNAFNRFYALPLGGAYLGQGRSMTSAGIAWGTPVPGPARSFYASINLTL
jgi:iron complex outermembrane recepter protein